MLTVEPAKNIKEFIDLPFKIYKGNEHYAGDLKIDTKHLLLKDPFWQNAERELFIAKRNGIVIGRIAAIINRNHNKHWEDKTGFFGFFECINSKDTAEALLKAAKDWLKAKGMTAMRGPMNPSTNHTCGILLDNYDKPPFVMMPYNHAYYIRILEGAGLKKAKDLLAFERTDEGKFSERMEKIMTRVLKNPSVKLRNINLKNISEEIEIVRTIYNAAWSRNWSFVPMTEPEIQQTAKQLKMIIKPEVTAIAEYDGNPAGFSICVPNMNHVLKILGGSLNPFKIISALRAWKNIKDCRMIMLGVHPDYQKKGLELLLVKHVVEEGMKAGWKKAELSWMLEDNSAIISVIEEAGCYKSKSYRIYETEI